MLKKTRKLQHLSKKQLLPPQPKLKLWKKKRDHKELPWTSKTLTFNQERATKIKTKRMLSEIL